MSQRSFTLIEVLVSLAVFSTVLVLLAVVIVSGNQIYSGVTHFVELRQNARNAMDRIVREVRESNSSTVITDPNNAGSMILSFYGPRFKDAAGALQPVRYSLDNGQVRREFPPGTVNAVAIYATQLSFVDAGPQIDIYIKVAKTVNNRPIEFSLNQKVRMRNE